MIRKTFLVALAMGLAASAAQAQSAKFEVSAVAGWTFSDGVDGDPVSVPGEGTFNRIDPKDSFSWGLRLGYLLDKNSEIGFLFDMQPTELEASGTVTRTVGDMSIYNYHGYYAYNFGGVGATARPYLLIGLGATSYGSVDATIDDSPQSIGGGTKFSGTGALGVKLFPFASTKFGLRTEVRFTPTYIKSDPDGWWCGYWGCYTVSDTQYSNQWEFNAGFVFRL